MIARAAITAAVVSFALSPLFAGAQIVSGGLQQDGIFGCNYAGAGVSSVGSLGATGGNYVPVADAAVELNTGYLVYKECVLRNIVDREREAATAAYQQKDLVAFLTGRNGNPLYPVSLSQDLLNIGDSAALSYLQGGSLSSLNPALQSQITTAIARNYYLTTRSPQSDLTCSYTGDLNSVLTGQTFSWEGLLAEGDPSCNPIYAYQLAQDQLEANVAAQQNETLTRLGWSNGFYDVTTTGPNGLSVTTPGAIVGATIQQALGTGFRQLENANDIGQMVGALFAGLTTQILSDNNGLMGLTTSIGGQPSYLTQVGQESSQGLNASVTNAALSVLNAALQTEQSYYQAVNGIATTLTQAIGQLRGQESSCWGLIIPQAEQYAQKNNLTLNIATSTQFSQAVIDAQITPLATTTAQNINTSYQALQTINNLIAGVQNTNSADVQKLSLTQLDQLVAAHALHTDQDVAGAQQDQTNVQNAMNNLIQQTAQTWGDGTPNTSNPYDVNSGWCNTNNSATAQMWAQTWSK